jgi:hypothetical protein
MKLTSNDTKYLKHSFPNIKLSYVKNIHKKVSSANIFLAIPKGNKYFAWFRTFKKYSICFLLELDGRKRTIRNIIIKRCCFNENLCINKGTILYGTLVYMNKQPFYFIEDIYFYKGIELKNYNHGEKINLMKELFKYNLKQTKLHYSDMIFGLPIIKNTREEINSLLKHLSYNIYCIQHRYLKNNNTYFNERVTIIQEYKKIFMVKANIECDIYKLYYKNKIHNKLEQYKTAFIPNIKTSVLMNKLFRNIKENANLDLLEESDDEEEFEDVRLDKYVDIEKQIKMMCLFSHKFKSWIPLYPLEKGDICNKQDITIIEKKYN